MTSVILILTTSLVAWNATNAEADSAKQYDFLIKGMDDQRQRLRTGMYHASGRFISESPDLGRLDGPIRIYSAFDFDADKFRFDRTEPIREGKVGAPGANPRSIWSPKMKGGRMIRLKDRNISIPDGLFQARIGSLTPASENDIKPLDVRAFGLFYWNDLTSFPATTYPKSLEYYEREKADEVVEEHPGIWKITKTFPEHYGRTLRRILWLDQNAGFSPIRLELRTRDQAMPAGYWPNPYLESDTTWAEISGAWVPKTARIVNGPGTPIVATYELSFDWESVNGVIPAETFTLEGLKINPGYQVVDDTLGREIIVGSIGRTHGLAQSGGRAPRLTPPRTAVPNRSWQGWVPTLTAGLAGLGGMTLVAAGWFRFRSVRRRPSAA